MRAAALAVALLLLDCDHAPAPSTPAPPATPAVIVVASAAEAARALGKRVSITGTAGNAKLGAIVQSGDLLVYCLDRPSWPDDQDGKTVTVEGTLERTDEFKATPTPEGLQRAGTSGGDLVLRKSEVTSRR
jgi:hypothetical protein